MLRVEHLTKSYGRRVVLDDFSYTFNDGVYALVGENGSGKTTLLSIIARSENAVRRSKGRILLDGIEIKKEVSEYQNRVGYMPQRTTLYPGYGVEDFLMYVAIMKGLGQDNAVKEVNGLLEELHLTDVRDAPIGSLSGGTVQRISLAQALIGFPDVILLDEPTVGLDPAERIAALNLIAKRGLHSTVIMATHLSSDIAHIAKEAVMLERGKLMYAGSTEKAMSLLA